MKYFNKLEGEKIYLSPANIEDAEIFTKWLNDFQVTDYIGRSTKIMTVEGEKKWLEDSLKDNDVMLSIIKKEDNQMIGNMTLFEINNINRTATLGIMIGETENMSKGYGTEAIRLMMDFAFNYLNLNNIMLNVMEFNKRAIRAYEKVGFKEFGRRKEASYINGKYHDIIYMEMLKKDFTESYIKNKNI